MKDQVVELRSATLVETDNLSIEHGLAVPRCGHCSPKCAKRIERMTVAGDEFCATVLDDSERAETVVLEFEDPLGMIEGRRTTGERHRLECHG